jgi:hypothetical protein
MHEPEETISRSNIVDIFTGYPIDETPSSNYVRLSPELDGLCLLYSSHNNSNQLYSMKILCWALRDDGGIDALVPWLDGVCCANELVDEKTGLWEGFYNPYTETLFFEPPEHKIVELDAAFEFFGGDSQHLQEFPDNIGTHALLIKPGGDSVTLAEVISWQLNETGELNATLIDEESVTQTPVLPGDACLTLACENPHFRYYFQHYAANQIKASDPDALAAIALLIGR